MSLTKMIVKLAAPTPSIESCSRFLFIGPHPDDIEIGAGACAAKLAAMGREVCFLICTDGRFGDSYLPKPIPADIVAKIRERESKAAASSLGIWDVRFLRLSDGSFYSVDELERGIAAVVGEFQPDVIFAPDPSVTSECHEDHLRVGRAAAKIACFAPYEGIMAGLGAKSAPVQAIAHYMTAKPNQYVATTGYLKKQLRSISDFHRSQFPMDGKAFSSVELYLKLRAYEYGVRSGHKTAEGFRVLGQTQMHCLPEAGN